MSNSNTLAKTLDNISKRSKSDSKEIGSNDQKEMRSCGYFRLKRSLNLFCRLVDQTMLMKLVICVLLSRINERKKNVTLPELQKTA